MAPLRGDRVVPGLPVAGSGRATGLPGNGDKTNGAWPVAMHTHQGSDRTAAIQRLLAVHGPNRAAPVLGGLARPVGAGTVRPTFSGFKNGYQALRQPQGPS